MYSRLQRFFQIIFHSGQPTLNGAADAAPANALGCRDLGLAHAEKIVLAQLPPTQARRVYQHYLLGMSKTEIAAAEGIGRSRICCSVERGLAAMKNILKKSL